jgi:hypothetical protein
VMSVWFSKPATCCQIAASNSSETGFAMLLD